MKIDGCLEAGGYSAWRRKQVPSIFLMASDGFLRPAEGYLFLAVHQLWKEQHRMRRLCSRLLITLVLLAVAASAVWTTAHARPREGARWARSYATAGVMIGSRPGARPASGEPDAGASKNPPLVSGRIGGAVEEPGDDPSGGSYGWPSRTGGTLSARDL